MRTPDTDCPRAGYWDFIVALFKSKIVNNRQSWYQAKLIDQTEPNQQTTARWVSISYLPIKSV